MDATTDENVWLATRYEHLYLGKINAVTFLIGGWTGPGLVRWKLKREIRNLMKSQGKRTAVVQSVGRDFLFILSRVK
jgi:hypothetical protein